jgi:hypothetical protein
VFVVAVVVFVVAVVVVVAAAAAAAAVAAVAAADSDCDFPRRRVFVSLQLGMPVADGFTLFLTQLLLSTEPDRKADLSLADVRPFVDTNTLIALACSVCR